MLLRYHVTIKRDVKDRRYVLAALTKSWWRGPGHQTESRIAAEAWMDCSGMTEDETIPAALEELARAYRDRLA